MKAYKGTSITGFPNLFMLLGPNTGLGHNSVVFMIEAQIGYVADALRTMRERGATTLEVTRQAMEAYDADVQRRLEGTVWNTGGCASWYLDDHGRNSTIWPGSTWTYKRRTLAFDPAAYDLRSARRVAAAVT
jgi:cyclohexanone monooxygenase